MEVEQPQASTSAVPLPSLSDLLLSPAQEGVTQISASDLRQPSARDYIARLLALSLDQLQAEPEKLAASSKQLDADLSHLCFRSYPSFLLSRSAASALETSFTSLNTSLDSLVAAADGLGTACASFAALVPPLQAQRTQTLHVLEQVDKVAEVIDLPRLVSTCVRSGGYWNEALDLALRADDLCARAPENAVLRRVRRDVEREIIGLEARIIETLRERSLKLPGAVRNIGLLKRIRTRAKRDTSVDAAEIRLAQILLCARWDCLRTQLDQLQSGLYVGDDRVRHLKRWIEIWREVVGETTSIYADIFLSTVPFEPRLGHALQAFLQHALSSLLSALDTHLPHISSNAALSSILTQLAYAGQAFARTHAFDFRSLVTLRIEDRVRVHVIHRMSEATAALRNELARKGAPLAVPVGAPGIVVTTFSPNPPTELTAIPPLARLLNGHATALNELRLLPALSIRPAIAEAQARELNEAADICAAASSAEEAQTLLVWLGHIVAPWCERALRIGVYGNDAGDEHPGIRKLKERCEPPKPAEVVLGETNGANGDDVDTQLADMPSTSGVHSNASV